MFPISEAVAEEFNAIAPKVRITVGVSGTGGGFKKFINNEIAIVMQVAASSPLRLSVLLLQALIISNCRWLSTGCPLWLIRRMTGSIT